MRVPTGQAARGGGRCPSTRHQLEGCGMGEGPAPAFLRREGLATLQQSAGDRGARGSARHRGLAVRVV
ncbi:hypothetical protein GN956_G11951 [Arapaima gigas]